jgi:hypothetical protein
LLHLSSEKIRLIINDFSKLTHYSTSGAKETIFENPLSFSSRAIGPKILVPRGLFSLLIITDALSSNLKREPSFLKTDCFVRTITALSAIY